MTFDLGALADRFRRAAERPIVPPPAAPPPPPAPVEGAWLTAESHPEYPRVTGHGPSVYSNTSTGSAPEAPVGVPRATGPSPVPPRQVARLTPEGPPSGRRRPKRRRWAMPASPAERRQEAVHPPPTLYRCPTCGKNHQPVRLEGAGVFAPYRKVIARIPGAESRPRPVGEDGNTTSLIRDGFHPWRISPAAEAVPPPLTLRERIAGLWRGDEA